MTLFYALLVAFNTCWTLAGVWAVWTVRRRKLAPAAAPPVSVLKPLCGVDPDLEGNLETFFKQDYPSYELIFGVQGDTDPAIEVVERLRARFPHIRSRLVIHNSKRGMNPKVRNLRAMLPSSRHDVILISDSNVAVEPHYVREMTAALAEPGIALVTNLVTVHGDGSLGATLEAMQLSGFIASGIATPNELMNEACVVGKSMLFRRSVFERLGGFESVAHVLAEDFVMGRMFQRAGYRTRICPTPVVNVISNHSVAAMYQRHLRWGAMRLRAAPHTWLLEFISIPLVLGLMAPLFGVPVALGLLWGLTLTVFRDAVQWSLLVGRRHILRAILLIPVRDLIHVALWAGAPFKRRVRWRGNPLTLTAGSRLFVEGELPNGTVEQGPWGRDTVSTADGGRSRPTAVGDERR
jgi:ceramide glucosyltransferase